MGSNHLPSTRFLAQPRPYPFQSPATELGGTTASAAHDFEVDTQTGFMPPQPQIKRLPPTWEPWELALDTAMSQKLQLGKTAEEMELEQRCAEMEKSRVWRTSVAQMPLLSVESLKASERELRRAHLVLVYLLHFYIHTLSPSDPLIIPRPLSIPLIQVSMQLQIPPVLTYSDNVLYNWDYKEIKCDSEQDMIPSIGNIRSLTTFTGTRDEEGFYLTTARIELRGAEALELMRLTMDETSVGGNTAVRRITGYFERMAIVVKELRELLLDIKQNVDTQFFYERLRPWYGGLEEDPWNKGRTWVFEGSDEVEGCHSTIKDVAGVTAGQSSLIQAFDIYLGVDVDSPPTSRAPSGTSFFERVRAYMPRQHRAFLAHLRANPRSLRDFVSQMTREACDIPILEAYNSVVKAVKEWRDAHMIIVTLYVIGPANRSRAKAAGTAREHSERSVEEEVEQETTKEMESTFKKNEKGGLKGTGGTDLVKFLKGLRDQTTKTYLSQ